MTTHWLRSPGPGTRALMALTAVLGIVAVVLHFAGLGDPSASAPGSLRNIFFVATFVSGFVTYLSGRPRS